MRPGYLRPYGCGLFIAVVLITALAVTGCADKPARVITPYGTYDTTTSQTLTIDMRPFFKPQLEK